MLGSPPSEVNAGFAAKRGKCGIPERPSAGVAGYFL